MAMLTWQVCATEETSCIGWWSVIQIQRSMASIRWYVLLVGLHQSQEVRKCIVKYTYKAVSFMNFSHVFTSYCGLWLYIRAHPVAFILFSYFKARCQLLSYCSRDKIQHVKTESVGGRNHKLLEVTVLAPAWREKKTMNMSEQWPARFEEGASHINDDVPYKPEY